MERQASRRWTQILICAALIQFVASKGTIELTFVSYRGDGKDKKGNCCDSIFPWGCGADHCDIYFFVCLDHKDGSLDAGDCHYRPRFQTGVIESNSIDFGASIGGTANPIITHRDSLPNDLLMKVVVMDRDPANNPDEVAFISATARNVTPTFNGNKGSYFKYTLTKSPRATLKVKLRLFCDTYYYGKACTKYCKDNVDGHYTCNTDGDKVCHMGWKGDNCNVDIDECLIPGFCHNGATCLNRDGGYSCQCADGFKGIHCEKVNHTCAINPCENGGSCNGNQTDFTCDCLPWWGGTTCTEKVDTCAGEPCKNGGTCIPNNVTSPGYTCNCKSDWTGEACDVAVTTTTPTTTTTTSPTTTSTSIKTTTPSTTVVYELGDPYFITLLGVIDETNILKLQDGLINLVKDLGPVKGDVYVKVRPKVIPIRDGVTTTYVEFYTVGEKGPVGKKLIDYIFESNTDDTINSYLPLPLYRPRFDDPEKQTQEWSVADNWYAIVLPVLAFIVIVACILAFIVVSRRKKEKENSFMRSDSTVEHAQPSDMAFENVLYHETHRNRQSDVVDGGEVTFTPSGRQLDSQQGACGENPYSQPVQYDTPVKQPTGIPNGGTHYQNSNLAALDTRCEAGVNNYTTFSDLDGAHARAEGENPYQELDDVLAEKAAIAVGFPKDGGANIPTDDDDSEDEIDKIKAQIRDDDSNA